MHLPLLFLGALSAAVAVAVGGARAHVLANRLAPARLTMLEVGMRYHLAHATAMILVALMLAHLHHPLIPAAGWGFALGTLLFPGLLYIYAFTGHASLLKLSAIGGVLFVLSWVGLALGIVLNGPVSAAG